MGSLNRALWVVVISICTFQASAGVISYRVDRNGQVVGQTDMRFYNSFANDRSYGLWQLDSRNNALGMVGDGGSGMRQLNTTLFSVSDITDITYSNNSYAWLTANNMSYRVDRNGQVVGQTDMRFYNSFANDRSYGLWQLDSRNNALGMVGDGGSGMRQLNTTLFSVSDITDITYSNNSYAWLTVETAEVSEPASLALIGLGLFGLALSRRKAR